MTGVAVVNTGDDGLPPDVVELVVEGGLLEAESRQVLAQPSKLGNTIVSWLR